MVQSAWIRFQAVSTGGIDPFVCKGCTEPGGFKGDDLGEVWL